MRDLEKEASIGFVVCVEPGPAMYEYKAACLFVSMRMNLGKFSNCSVYAYSPRPGMIVANWLIDMMHKLDITYIKEPLNEKYQSYPIANKVFSFAHAEENMSEDFIVFLDTDTILWKSPDLFLLKDGVNLALCPERTKTV